MSPRIALCAAALCAAIGGGVPRTQAQSVSTDPVGFVTLSIPGTGGTATNAISFKSLGLVQPVAYQGSAETVNVANKTLTDDQATWTENQFNGANGTYYLEIVRPVGQSTPVPGEGTTYDIASTSAATKTITVAQPLDATIVNGANFKIRKHWTLGSVFGATNTAGFQAGTGSTTADQIQIWNGTGFSIYYYQIGAPELGGTGWRSQTSAYADASEIIIYPDDGLIFRLLKNEPVNVVVLGAVKTGVSSFPIASGFNILANVYPMPLTLESSGLQASGFTGGTGPTTSDQVLLWNGIGYDIYFYQIGAPALGGTGWRSVRNVYADAGTTQIPSGASIVVKRTQGGPFNWVVPQHPANL